MILNGSLGILKIRIAGEDDHLCPGIVFVDKARHLKAVCCRHFDVRDHNVHRLAFQKFHGFHAVRSASHNLTVNGRPVHVIGNTFSHSDFIVNYKKLKYHG